MTSAFAIILYIYLLSFGKQCLCNNTRNEDELFRAVKDGKLKSIKLIKSGSNWNWKENGAYDQFLESFFTSCT